MDDASAEATLTATASGCHDSVKTFPMIASLLICQPFRFIFRQEILLWSDVRDRWGERERENEARQETVGEVKTERREWKILPSSTVPFLQRMFC